MLNHTSSPQNAALFACLHQKLIPGLGKTIRILLLSQLEDSTLQQGDDDDKETVLQHVVRSDRARCKVQADFERAYALLHIHPSAFFT